MRLTGLIVGLTGRKGSGKNLAALGLPGFQVLAFADPLKGACMDLFGLTEKEMQDPELKEVPLERWPFQSPRIIMQKVGTDAMRANWPTIWVEALRRKLAVSPHRNAVITDCRFLNEAEMIRQLGGYIIRIVRPGMPQTDIHPSETEMDSMVVDATVINDGNADDLHRKTAAAVISLMQ
jgi:hypothetical protein